MEDRDPAQWLEETQLGGEEIRVLRKMFTAGGRYPHQLMYKEAGGPQISAGGEVVVKGQTARYVVERLVKLELITPRERDKIVPGLYPLTEFGVQVAGVLEATDGIRDQRGQP